LLLFACLTALAQAQHDQGSHQHGAVSGSPQESQAQPSSPDHQMPGMTMPDESADAQAHGPDSPLSSGTAWQPTSSPAYMWMWSPGDWTVMAHGALFLGYNQQGGPRGVGKLESENWLMLMQHHRLGPGTLQFREMLSAEPGTAPPPGFPQLFQTGETYKGRPLVDHQHPHDLFSELSARFNIPLSERVSWLIYGGPAAEPALGPVAFPHRVSAMENPAAPLGHHLQDSTHISYGVVTTGLQVGRFKAEGSVFNGREPDEHRATIDLGALDSWSLRFSVSPNANWTAQYSYGQLTQPEAAEPGDIKRQTASISYNRSLVRGNWISSLIWGRNHKDLLGTNQNGYLLESALNFARRNYAYTRLELVDKDELFLDTGGLAAQDHNSFRIGAFTFGGVRDLVQNRAGQLGLGADVTFYSKPAALDPVYGRNPVSFHVFLRFRPGLMQH
jgi:hypothetical protein